MAQSSGNDKEYRLIIEKMRFSEPRILILYSLFGLALYLFLFYLGNRLEKLLTHDKLFFITLLLIIYVPFVIRGFINKIHEFLEIGEMTQMLSPMRSLFVSEEAFFKYRHKIIEKIFSKWHWYFSVLFLLSWVITQVYYDIWIKHSFGKPFGIEFDIPIWGKLIQILSLYLTWWIAIFAFLSLIWALFWFIISFVWLKDSEGLKINESIKSFKTLVDIKKCDEETLSKSLGRYYTYNRLLADSGKIAEISYFIAVRVALVGFLLSVGHIGIMGFKFQEWNLPLIGFTIFIDTLSILIFIIPQFSIYKILKSAKSEFSNIVADIYELNKICAVVRTVSFSQVEESLIKNLAILKGIVDETNRLKTWTIDLQAVIKLTATIISTVLPYLIQKLLS